MSVIKEFVYNAFQEKTYLIYDETKECIIVDCGCSNDAEFNVMKTFIEENNLTPRYLVNTHCHIDHAIGNHYIVKEYGIEVSANKKEEFLLTPQLLEYMSMGMPMPEFPPIKNYLSDGDTLKFGNTEFKILEAPGHSPGSILLYNPREQYCIVGDVLFYGSIGRSDLPQGDYDVLMHTLENVILRLPDDTKILSGHGPSTTIGFEKQSNPFLEPLYAV